MYIIYIVRETRVRSLNIKRSTNGYGRKDREAEKCRENLRKNVLKRCGGGGRRHVFEKITAKRNFLIGSL